MAANEVDLFVRKLLDRYVEPEMRVLDVGCGPAPYKEWIAGQYIGLDITDLPYGPGMPRCADVVASAMNIPLADNSVDVVFSKSAFCLVPDPDAVLREFRRVLTSQGRLLLLDYNRRTQRQLMALDGSLLPCWTQWGLKARVKRAGFRDAELLVPKIYQPKGPEFWLRLAHQELLGTWAIVTAVK